MHAGTQHGGGHRMPDIVKTYAGYPHSFKHRVPCFPDGITLQRIAITIPDECFNSILNRLFNVFNFTVMENTPSDVDVAVDPEMLGKIFERLVTGRQDTGSYYTPKTIVSFMCREALKAYLVNYNSLVDKLDVTGISVPEARSILDKLSKMRICDPACGSGAYLVGMLHELHKLMQSLDTKSSATARDNYHLKLDIIQNNLYGVDLDPFAVNIARLRLWLTLAVEYDGEKPEPLPNLDFKIEAGDSLIAPDPHQASQQAIVGELAKKLNRRTNEHMRNHSYGEKPIIKKEIEELQSQIAGWLHAGATISGFDWGVQFADVFTTQGGFDVVLANPPYGIACEDPLRFKYFPRVKGEDPQSKDSYGLFIVRGLQLLRPGGVLTNHI